MALRNVPVSLARAANTRGLPAVNESRKPAPKEIFAHMADLVIEAVFRGGR
jgi:hypothetical protein